ncbi:MAG: ABC transporter ATP-binding protein [Eubacteriales bacterium]|nr:ABC transporter ATP-binding protein [Eubacteriales bacterium]
MDEVILRCENIGLKRKDFELKGVSLEIRAGYITVITGSNGAGKSTLLSILSGNEAGYTGKLWLSGCDLREAVRRASKRSIIEKIGHISEEPVFFMECDSIENEMFLSPHFMNWDRELYRNKLKEFDISTATPIKHLSRGNFIKFQLAWAMAHNADIYLFDEPTAGLDPVYRKKFYRQLQELVEGGAAVVVATNLYEDVEQIADYHIIIEAGKIISEGKVEER